MRVTVIGSGSKGNAIIIDFGHTRIAVDAGFGPRMLARRMKAAGIAPESVCACAVTHEHLDHSKGALRARDKWRWTLTATPPTLWAIGASRSSANILPLAYGHAALFGDVRMTLLPVSHDAVSPAAVLLEDTATGARVGIAHDLGEIPAGLATSFARLDVLVLEANHDMGMLRSGPYPPMLQERIAGPRGHLSNAQAAGFAAQVAHRGLKAVILAHLSEENNTPRIAHDTVSRALRRTRFKGTLVAAAQRTACGVGDIADTQLCLL